MEKLTQIENVEGNVIFQNQSPFSVSTQTPNPETNPSTFKIGEDIFPFTNRDSEIRELFYSPQAQHYLVEAPMGYGKTRLLQRLEELFNEAEDKWHCKYIPIHCSSSPSLALNKIIEDANKTIEDTIYTLDTEVKNTKARGLILLVDFQGILKKEVFVSLLETIAEAYDHLSEDEFYTGKSKWFRTILAGRNLNYLYQQAKLSLRRKRSEFSFKPLPLSAFDYTVICDSAGEYLTKKNARAVEQLSAHLLHLTGGHPSCVATIINKFGSSKRSADSFIEKYEQEILGTVVSPIVKEIHSDLGTVIEDEGVQKFLFKNVLRYIYSPVLFPFIEKYEIKSSVNKQLFDSVDLHEKLSVTQLFDKKIGSILADGIVRRLFTIHLWSKDPETFKSSCKLACEACEAYLRKKDCQFPSKWTLEYLFQFLQQYAPVVNNRRVRQKLRQDFFEIEVPRILDILVEVRDKRVVHLELMTELENEDDIWEFKYTVNYFLRKNQQYSPEPFKTLTQHIDKIFQQV